MPHPIAIAPRSETAAGPFGCAAVLSCPDVGTLGVMPGFRATYPAKVGMAFVPFPMRLVPRHLTSFDWPAPQKRNNP